jgi:hypothetical protein
MPISLRLPLEIETQIAGFSTRTGVTKSAVIVRSIQEFLAKHAVPTSVQIYEEAMGNVSGQQGSEGRELSEHRPLKLQVRKALRSKHAERSARATQALAVPQNKAVKSR